MKSHRPQPAGPLAGIKIIDLTSVMMGPYATMILGDYGADVIKVESPEGDVMRYAAPMRHPQMGAMYLQGNRSKRSIVLDEETGRRGALLRLSSAPTCSLVSPAGRDAPPAARRRRSARAHSAIVYASLHGFGGGGPTPERVPAYDDLIQGMTALLPLVTGKISGEPRFCRQRSPIVLSASTPRMRSWPPCCTATAPAKGPIHRRSRCFGAIAQFVLAITVAAKLEPPIGRPGYSRLLSADRRPYGPVTATFALVYTDSNGPHFSRDRAGNDAQRDPRLSSMSSRTSDYDYVYRWFSEIIRTRNHCRMDTSVRRGRTFHMRRSIDLDGLMNDPHLAAVRFIQSIDHPTEGRLHVAGPAATWSKTPPSIRHYPPGLGEHGSEILREAGFSDDDIEALVTEGVLIQRDPEDGSQQT